MRSDLTVETNDDVCEFPNMTLYDPARGCHDEEHEVNV